MSAARAVALAVLLVGACRDASTPFQPESHDGASRVVPGQYIVVFRDTVADPVSLAQSLVNAQGGTLLHTYTSALKGFAARLPDAGVARLGQDPLVAYVEPDRKDSMPGTQQMDANGDPWGLDRIDQRALPLSGTYTYTSTGAGVHVYLIDTGIWTPHPEFGGRADNLYDVVGGDGMDCQGHGTAVAGVVGAATYGVAKGVFLHGIRVADCNFGFSTSGVVAGIDWVTANHQSPAVANIPMQADPSTALATAIKKLWDSGVFVGTTAGNHNQDACLEASGGTPFPVAASTRTDARADFSNWGPCVKIYAPGENIKSTGLGGTTPTVTGTSFAAPHVTGVAALYKATFGDAPSDVVATWILNNATPGVITGNPDGTPNLLLYSPAAPSNQPPVANFTSSCSALSCSFTSTSSDPDGSIAAYSWTFGDGGTATAQNPSHTYGTGGSYTVTLTVTDNQGATSAPTSKTVTVTPPNQPPTANFTFSCTGLTCSFDASSSTAQATATYSWSWGDAATGTGKTATHTYGAAGSYSVTLTVTDGGGSNSVSETVTVSPANQPPSAAFTSSCSGLTCSFTSTSSDPDGSIASYSWTFGDGATSTAQNPSHLYGASGTYTVTLQVTDNQGATNSTSNNITVTAPNQPPTATFTFSCSALTCSFTSTSSDPDGSVASYSWTFGDGGTSTAQNPSHTYGAGGSYTVTLRVTDNQGAQSTPTSKTVTVNAPNQPPTANFTFSCSGLSCSFTSTSSDPDGTIASYSWTFGDGGTATAQNPSHTYGTGGSYTVTLRVTDNQGATSSPVSKTVTVTAPNSPPIVNAGPDEGMLIGLFYSLSASFSDPNNDGPWSYTISWGDGSSSSGSTPSQGTISASHTYLLLGSYTITVKVTDSHGASGSDSKAVTFIL